MSRDRSILLGTAAVVTAASLFATLGPLSRFGAEAGVEGIAFTFWRALLGTLALTVGIVARRGVTASRRALAGLDARGRGSLLLVAVMGLTLNASIFTAFGRIPIGLALMLFYTYPAGVALVDVLLGRERATPARLAALGLASIGVVLVLAGGLDLEAGIAPDLLGIALALCASASQIVFVTVSRTGYRAVPADTATAIILGVSVIGAAPIALLAGQGPGLAEPLRAVDPWPIILFAGVVAAGLTSFLFLFSIRTIGSTRAGILMLIEPVVGVLLAGLWLGEAMAPIQALGGALVLGGAVILQRSSKPANDPITEPGASPVV